MKKSCLESDLCSQQFHNLSNKVQDKLKSFFMAQQALSRELLAAKPLGICKITTSIDPKGIGISTSIEGSKEMYL